MQIILGFLMGILWVLTVAVLRSFTTLFHELGHAIPSLVFTQKDVRVFVGTYGDTTDGFHMRVGRLHIFFKFNLFNWNIGMCAHEGVLSTWKNIIIVIGGPIASLCIAAPLIWLLSGNANPMMMYILMAFVIAACFDFLVNIIPSSSPISTQGGSLTFNDGYTLLALISRMNASSDFLELEEHFHKGEYRLIIDKGENLLKEYPDRSDISFLLIEAYKKQKLYDKALLLYIDKSSKQKLSTEEFLDISELYLHLQQYQQAIPFLNRFLHYHYDHDYALTLRGIALYSLRHYQESMNDLEIAIRNNPSNGEAHLYKGFIHHIRHEKETAHIHFQQALMHGMKQQDIDEGLGMISN